MLIYLLIPTAYKKYYVYTPYEVNVYEIIY